MQRAFITIIALAGAATISAQTRDTKCRQVPGGFNCKEQSSPLDQAEILRRGAELVKPQPSPAQPNQGLSNFDRYRIGRAILKGQCEKAETIALEGGDIDYAKQAKTYCEERMIKK